MILGLIKIVKSGAKSEKLTGVTLSINIAYFDHQADEMCKMYARMC